MKIHENKKTRKRVWYCKNASTWFLERQHVKGWAHLRETCQDRYSAMLWLARF